MRLEAAVIEVVRAVKQLNECQRFYNSLGSGMQREKHLFFFFETGQEMTSRPS